MNMNYKGKPYPEVRVERPNIEYAKILLQDYAGVVSEETAINLYMYQNFIKSGIMDAFAKEIEKIAIVEMHHLDLLGRTIFKLGLNPIYATISAENNGVIYWNSKNVDYTDKIEDMLIADIKSEATAIKQYKQHREEIDDKYVKDLLDRIIEDEKEHLRIFEEMYASLNK